MIDENIEAMMAGHPICVWCFVWVAPEDEVGNGKDYVAHAECHEIQT